ncbi:MAG TPA: hypothetical protein VJX67_17855 [Blastocatellia bacterium]|nr:hypothetical protein [Blastocatellia bacterium]
MIKPEDIHELQQYPTGPDSAVLSVYVNVDQSKAANLNRGFETAVEDQLRRIGEQQTGELNGKRPRFEAERDRVMRFLREYLPKGKSVVLFSDSTQGLWWRRDVQVGLETKVRWSSQPWLRPLLELLEEHDRIVVALIDRQRSRIISLDAAGITEQADLISDTPGKHHSTAADHLLSQGQIERDHINHIKLHARRAVEEIALIVGRLKANKLVIGGAVEATSKLVDELPKRLAQIVIGTISVPVDAGADRLLGELRTLQGRAEQEEEIKVVDSLITSALKGERAVLGISDTLGAIHQGRVYRLVVSRGYRTEGKQCASCQVLVTGGLEKCAYCGGNLDAAPDLINRSWHKVLEQAGSVQMISGAAAEKLASVGNIGAILRF